VRKSPRGFLLLTAAIIILAPPLTLAGSTQRMDPKLEPYCTNGKWFDEYLRKNGFQPDDRFEFKSGASITRYRFLGDVLWLAVTPEGRECLLPMGMLRQHSAHDGRAASVRPNQVIPRLGRG
jgi:hypothetical protein